MDNQHLSFTKGRFTATTDPAFFQLEAIHDDLSQSSWAPGIDAETVRISIQNSLCFALLDGTRQVGFARLVTDSTPWLYQKLGYTPLNRPDFVWQINRPDIYRNAGQK